MPPGEALVENWDGVVVPVRHSRGAAGVLTFERWQDNVLGSPPWPDALLRQVRGYVANPRHFTEDDALALGRELGGRISKFQSINSEDAVTYSWFGTLARESIQTRRSVIQWLYDRAGIPATATTPIIDQWARVFHPNAPGSDRGPELDARIDDPGGALVYVEAKWHAAIGTGRGKVAGVRDDQVVLRRDSLRADPALHGDVRELVVLGVSPAAPDLKRWVEHDPGDRPVTITWLTWDDLAECSAHPLAAVFGRYLAWKRRHAALNGRASEGGT